MTQFFDLMVDVECLGKSETAALLSIGAVFFDLHTCTLGPTFQRTIHLATAMRDGGTVDAATILWWMGQGEKARNGISFGGHDIVDVLADFSDFIAQTCRTADVRPWGNSASFDLPKIRTAYERIGAIVPWHCQQAMVRMAARHQRGLPLGFDGQGLQDVPTAIEAFEVIAQVSSPMQMQQAITEMYRRIRGGHVLRADAP